MTARAFGITSYVLLLLLAGCANIAPLLSAPTPDPVPQPTSTPRPPAAQTAPVLIQPRVLRVWLPPRFDPNAGTASANLFKQRLADFESSHPGMEVEVRIKAEEGETGLLNSLSITSLAAPAALPDLIALSNPDMESAALKGLLHPMDGLSTILHDPNWYAYARALGRIQNIGYGLPFAGDALVLAHRPGIEVSSWDEILSSGESFLFPAGDPQGLVALSLYVSAGGGVVNEQGLPTLEEEPLRRVLTLIQNSVEAKALSPSLLDLETDAQVLQAYRNGRADIAITWAVESRAAGDDILQPIPSLGDAYHTFANAWVWALAGAAPENQQAATELAEYFIADEFINEWLGGTGYLPTRLSSGGDQDAALDSILESARPIPTNDALSVLGPIMNQALSRVLNGEQAEAVVRSVMEQVR